MYGIIYPVFLPNKQNWSMLLDIHTLPQNLLLITSYHCFGLFIAIYLTNLKHGNICI